MSHRTARLLFPTLLVLAAAARLGEAQAPGTSTRPAASSNGSGVDRSADEQAIRALSKRWLDAQRRKDVDAIMTHFASDAAVIYGGKLHSGSAAIRQNAVDDFAAFAKSRPDLVPSWETTSVEVSQSGDMAWETGSFDDAWNGGKDRERGHYLTVWRKTADGWKVARDVAVAEPKPDAARAP